MKLLAKIREPWGVARILQLVIALFFAYEAVKSESWILLLLVAVILYQAVMNIQCLACGITGSCEVPEPKSIKVQQKVNDNQREG